MTADQAREELEAIIWRTRCIDQHAIIGILAAADRYATIFAAEAIDGLEHDRRIAIRRANLIADDGKRYGRTG